MSFASIILAAGRGKRMNSDLPKVLHRLAGTPLVLHAHETASSLDGPLWVVVGHGGDRVRDVLPPGTGIIDQGKPRGTGHAVQRLLEECSDLPGNLLVLAGDVPLIRPETLRKLMDRHVESQSSVTILTCVLDEPGAYGRIIRADTGNVTAIREYSDADEEVRRLREINTGIYVFDTAFLRDVVPVLNAANAQGEIYLTDCVAAAVRSGRTVETVPLSDPREMHGINTRKDLAIAHGYYYEMIADRLMEQGVTLIDPISTRIDAATRIGRDTIIHPGVTIHRSDIGRGCEIHSHTVIEECRIGADSIILPSCVLSESTAGRECRIGPFAHLRPGCLLGDRVRFGNFVEGKKATLGEGTKAGHLSYLGDCELGREVNVGCGTITCNYDGREKHRTMIEDGVFIGSDSQFVAPVTIGAGAYVGAGSTITRDVPPGSLAIARGRQRNIEGWAEKRRKEEKS